MAKVLYVDDEKDALTYVQMLLEDNGHVVKTAQSGQTGAQLLQEFRPDLILLDIIMPLTSGINLYKKIRSEKKYAKIPVVFLSAVVRHREQFADQFAGLPQPQGYIDKPFEAERFISLINSILKI